MFDKYKIIFWDFDGVNKESVEVKTNAVRELLITKKHFRKK